MAENRTLKLNLLADITSFQKGMANSQTDLAKFSKQIESAGRTAGIAFAAIGATAIYSAKGLEEAQRASAKLDNVLTSMGFGEATKRVDAYAESLQNTLGIDADLIKATQTKLATFKNLTATVNTANGAFDRATMAAIDLAAAGFGEASQNAVQLGKALEDPIKGITALARSGVTFTEQEKEKIKTLVKSNDLLGAQDIVLKAIEKQVGGTAAANVSDFDKIKLSLDGVRDAIGTGILPIIEKVTPKLQAFSVWAGENSALLSNLVIVVGSFAGAVYAMSLIVKTAATIQAFYNLVLAANPIGLVVVAVVALGAAFVAAYKNIEPFRNLIDSIWESMKRLINTISNSSIGQAVSKAFNAVTGKASGGTVSAGQAYTVGEFGKEVFVPSTSGRIVPNSQLGGNVTINLNGIIDAESARRSIEKLLQDSARRTGAINLVGATL